MIAPTTEVTVQIPPLEQRVPTVLEKAKAIAITDQHTYDEAAVLLRAVATLEREIVAYHKPLKEAANKAHRAVCEAEKGLLTPLTEARRIVSTAVAKWQDDQEKERRRQQALMEQTMRAAQEEQALEVAIEAEAGGAGEEVVEQVLASASAPVSVVAAPTYTRAAGIASRETWSAKIVSLKQLVQAAARNDALLCYLLPNTVALNAQARALKTACNIPGVQAVRDTGISVRSN